MKQILDQTELLKILGLPREQDEKSQKLLVRKKIVQALSNFDYFLVDSSEDQIDILERLADQAVIGIISKGSFLFQQGDICNAVYVLLDGSVEVIKENNLVYQEVSQLYGQEVTGLNILGEVSLIGSSRNEKKPSNDPSKRRKGSIESKDNDQQDQLRSHSVRGLQQSVLIQLSISNLSYFLASKISSRAFLSSIFSTFHVNIPADLFFQTHYFNRHCKQLTFQVGTHILEQNTPDDGCIYVVFQGQCALQKTEFTQCLNNDIDMLRSKPSTSKQKTITLLEITSGVIFGIESDNIFTSPSDEKRLVSVVCSQNDTIVFQVSKLLFHGEEHAYGRETLQKMASLKLKRIKQLIKFDFRRISIKRGKRLATQKSQVELQKQQNQSQSPDKQSIQQNRSVQAQARPKSMHSVLVLPENDCDKNDKFMQNNIKKLLTTRQSHARSKLKLRNAQEQYMEVQLEGTKRKKSLGIALSTRSSSERASSAVKERKETINQLFTGNSLKTRPSMSSLLADIQVMSRHNSTAQAVSSLSSNQILLQAPHTLYYPSSPQLGSFPIKISNPIMSLNSFPDSTHNHPSLTERLLQQQLPSSSSSSSRSSFSLHPKTDRKLSFSSSNKALRNPKIQPFGALIQQKQSNTKPNKGPYLIRDTFQPFEIVPSSRVSFLNLIRMHSQINRAERSQNGLLSSSRVSQNGATCSPVKQKKLSVLD